jgi:hypothetical protein
MIVLPQSAGTFRNKHQISLLLLITACICSKGWSQAGYPDYLSELASARQETIQTGTIKIDDIELGDPGLGKNHFAATAQNESESIITLELDLRADPGPWVAHKWQRQFQFVLQPKQQQTLEAEYEFDRLTAEAWLRVRFRLLPTGQEAGTQASKFFFEKKYFVGKRNKVVDSDPFQKFAERTTEHFRIEYLPSSPAATDIDLIVKQREKAYVKVSQMLEVTYPEPIRLILFPDAEIKTRETGHQGAGWATGNIMVEIYNAQTKLDPYHELTHVLASQLGDPPAAFNEGLAVYVAESAGADALKDLGSPGMSVDAAVVAHRAAGKCVPMERLFALTDIGPDESQPTLSYPEAASFVKYLVQKYGIATFRGAYKSLVGSDNPVVIQQNEQSFQTIYGKSPLEMERDWLKSLPPAPR